MLQKQFQPQTLINTKIKPLQVTTISQYIIPGSYLNDVLANILQNISIQTRRSLFLFRCEGKRDRVRVKAGYARTGKILITIIPGYCCCLYTFHDGFIERISGRNYGTVYLITGLSMIETHQEGLPGFVKVRCTRCSVILRDGTHSCVYLASFDWRVRWRQLYSDHNLDIVHTAILCIPYKILFFF